MTIFLKDSNEFEANQLYLSRENFKNEIYPLFIDRFQGTLYDHFLEKPYFGKVDKDGNSIFPSEKFLKELDPKVSNFLFVQDFVKDAFLEMDTYFKRGIATRKLKVQQSPYSSLLPRQTFSNSNKSYTDYLNKFNLVLAEYLTTVYGKKRITNFSDFVEAFLNFLKEKPGLIVFTRTKFLLTNLCDKFSSGLSISLSTDQYDNDLNKLEVYVKDNNFPFFLESCRRHSFVVDKNAPWLLHFDFNSPASKKYLEKYSLTDENSVYEKRFYKAFYGDITILKKFLIHAYMSYISNSPSINVVVDVNDCLSPKIQTVAREAMDLKKMNIVYSDMDILKLYFDIRILEENLQLKESKYNQIVLDAKNILVYGAVAGDRQKFISALAYVNEVINANKAKINTNDLLKY
jgi:hypothetical protein